MTVKEFLDQVTPILAPGGAIAAVLTYLIKRRPSVTKEDATRAKIAATLDPNTRELISAMSRQIAEQAEAHAEEIAQVRGLLDELRVRFAAVEGEVTRWRAFGRDLAINWATHRESENPPVLPEP